MVTRLVLCMALAGLVYGLPAALAEQKPSGGGEAAVILDSFSTFRCHFERSGVVVKTDNGWWPKPPARLEGPKAGWTRADFDESNWRAMPGPFFPGRYGAGFCHDEKTDAGLSLICLRALFHVTDPSSPGELKLNLDFRGGAVVYVNGKEIARSHLPKGKLAPSDLAEAYPKEAYVKPDGQIIRCGWQEPEKYSERVALRTRHISGLAIPARLLRKGANVLAIELHRAPHHAVTLTKARKGTFRFYGFRGPARLAAWTTVGLSELTLTATGTGVRPDLTRPRGFQIFNADCLSVVYDVDYAPRGAALRPIRITAARNGSFAGQAVVSRDDAITGLSASVSALRREGGGKTIASSALRVRYPQPTGPAPRGYLRLPGGDPRHTDVKVFDALAETPPAKVAVRTKKTNGGRPVVYGAVQPLWLTVRVPADAQPGIYAGKLTVRADGLEPTPVPIRVEVGDWVVPPPRQWRTHVDLVQSPESVSLYYGSAMWSDEHFAQLERSFRLLASVGNKTVYVPLIAKTDFGNSQTMLRWTRQKDGSLKPDFRIVDRYLALAKKHLAHPPVVCLYVWDRPHGGRYFGGKLMKHGFMPPEVSVIDAATGAAALVKVPAYDQPAAKAFWRPAADGLRRRLDKLGWSDSLMLGICDDFAPDKKIVALWHELLPAARWVAMGHSVRTKLYMAEVGYCTHVWGAHWADDPSVKRTYGWARKHRVAHFDRDSWRAASQAQLLRLAHLAGERNITGEQRGFGRLSADFWPVKEGQGRDGAISARYPNSSKGQLQIRMDPYLWPGPEGAISTIRLEMMREGLTACEARITIEAALLDRALRARLGEARAMAYQALLDERTRWLRKSNGAAGEQMFIASDWRGRNARLFAAAAEVNRLTASRHDRAGRPPPLKSGRSNALYVPTYPRRKIGGAGRCAGMAGAVYATVRRGPCKRSRGRTDRSAGAEAGGLYVTEVPNDPVAAVRMGYATEECCVVE